MVGGRQAGQGGEKGERESTKYHVYVFKCENLMSIAFTWQVGVGGRRFREGREGSGNGEGGVREKGR